MEISTNGLNFVHNVCQLRAYKPKTLKKINIAIDGYAGCGKSTTAQLVAKALDYIYIDTGAMYRAFSLYLLEHQIGVDNLEAIENALTAVSIRFAFYPETGVNDVLLNGSSVKQLIRQPNVSSLVSDVSALRMVRLHMVHLQQVMAQTKGVVMDGRDIGTVVIPDAELKIFMYADMEARVIRRKNELERLNIDSSVEEIRQNLLYRDKVDTTRAESPLYKAIGAKELDTSDLTIEQQVSIVVQWANEILINQTTFAEQENNKSTAHLSIS